jgi:hypothetical protein
VRIAVLGGTRFTGRALVEERAGVEEAVARSVRRHLDNPPAESDTHFSADDRALGLQVGDTRFT